jgi:hypothetical protein
MLNKTCTRADSYRQAKSAPSRFFGEKAGTQPRHIAGQLCLSELRILRQIRLDIKLLSIWKNTT